MNFFKDLFNFKRTRMIDEAVFFHKPVSLGKNILSFIVTLVIATLIVSVLQSMPYGSETNQPKAYYLEHF